ncbi:MAG: LPS export ABC transporter periplasmic protein LptC [Rhizobiaceae bacterium]
MTSVAIPQSPHVQEYANKRTDGDFKQARNHTLYVSLLKKLFPLAAIAITIFFVVSTLISLPEASDISVKNVGLKDGKLVMDKPTMTGFDKNNQPYDVKAEKAIQDLTKPGIIELEIIDAKLPMDAKGFALINADNGIYNTNDETMFLRSNVKIKGARGMDINMEEANINIKTGTMETGKPVTVVSGDTNISADSMSVKDNGKRIIFKKRVKMIIKRPISRGVKPPADNKTN